MAGLEIIDGTGKGFSVKVDANNKLTTSSVSEPEIRRINHIDGTVWSIDIPTITAGGAGNEFVYIRNDGEYDLAIEAVRLSSTVATRIRLFHVSGTPSFTGENTATLTANNLGSSKSPNATIITCTAISGLNDEGSLLYMELDTVNKMYSSEIQTEIIIPRNKAVALERIAASGAITGYILLVQHRILSSDKF
jgi:hypothetical protein